MKKFQELPQQSMINEPFSRSASFCWWILQASEQEKVLFGSSKVKNKTPFNNDWRKVLNKAASKWNARKSVMMLCMVTLFLLLTPFSFVKLFKRKWLMSCNCIKKVLSRHQVNPLKSTLQPHNHHHHPPPPTPTPNYTSKEVHASAPALLKLLRRPCWLSFVAFAASFFFVCLVTHLNLYIWGRFILAYILRNYLFTLTVIFRELL